MDKEKILNAWIMTEHLSEGDIDSKDKNLLRFDKLTKSTAAKQDYHQFFKNAFQEATRDKKIGKKGGMVVYFDIFQFEDLVKFLRKEFKLENPEEDIRYGEKFSFALYFDRDFQYDKDKFFYTESAYIRQSNRIPEESEFRKFEQDEKAKLEQKFEETAENPEKFNRVMQEIIDDNNVGLANCRFQFVQNLETDATNLHSFFTDDLEKAKKLDTPNLAAYLSGGRPEDRINLDSKKESPNFNQDAFIDIMAPECYPLGRFPSNTQYALSFMQQVAVNMASLQVQDISSVNGPPGTGKTTLLKDIFADLIVKQALSIAQMKDHCIAGTEEMRYYENSKIGELPPEITLNSIVVASSNNGAVQNIVNELPLRKDIDEAFKSKLDDLDYFKEIANTPAVDGGEETADKKEAVKKVAAPLVEQKFWGLFSLEGGKSANMKTILNQMSRVVEYFKSSDYKQDKNAYQRFLDAYQSMKKWRDQVGAAARVKRDADELDKQAAALREEVEDLQTQQEENQRKFAEIEPGMEIIRKRHQKSGVSGIFKKIFGGEETANYNSDEKAVYLRYKHIKTAVDDSKLRLLAKKQELDSFECRLQALQDEAFDKEIWKLVGENPLNFNQPYDELQLSNPWFNREFRIRQTGLFVLALAVRKQFLYENRNNIKAAVCVWNNQSAHLENKRIITAAWNWINMTIPVISSTFASFGRMMKNINPQSLGYVFVDEAGQALPQAAVGAIWRSRRIMVVGDPSQIKPVLTLEDGVLALLRKHYAVSEAYLSEGASVQTLVDAAGHYGFYTESDKNEDSWIGIPLWVHRRCRYPMFTIANEISYHGFMVQGVKKYGKTGWFDVSGKAQDKYVAAQGRFLKQKLQEMIAQDPDIIDQNKKDKVYIISPFRNVAQKLAKELESIKFTRKVAGGKITNIGTVHTFQGKEAPIVFLVLGADEQSKGAANWAVGEPNIMNVAATRAKEEFYIIGDKKMYEQLDSDVVRTTVEVIEDYRKENPDKVVDVPETDHEGVNPVAVEQTKTVEHVVADVVAVRLSEPPAAQQALADGAENHVLEAEHAEPKIKICPKCGSKMVRRMAKKGANAGKEFWGCSSYPKCWYTENIDN